MSDKDRKAQRAREEAAEAERLAAMRARLDRRTHKDQLKRKKPAHVDDRLAWMKKLPPLPPPIKQPDAVELEDDQLPPREGLIPGTYRLVDPSRLGGIVDRPRLPSMWTARHVADRLIEAHEVLARLPENIWPKQFGAAWPAYRHDWADQVIQAGAKTLLVGRNRPPRGASADEVARMSEAIAWPLQFLSHSAMTARDINLWAAEQSRNQDFDEKSAPWEGLQMIADALNAAKESVR